jgi:hypothetical protein
MLSKQQRGPTKGLEHPKERQKMKAMKAVLLSLIACTSFGLVGCISHTRERVVEERPAPGVVIEHDRPAPDTTINVHP